MDNDFGDDDGQRQARSRRRFQTGLLIFLLLFFMDAKTPQETQNQNKRNAQAKTNAKNLETTGKTVEKLAQDLKHVPHGSSYALRDVSTIIGEWHHSDGEDFRTVVPAMKTKGAAKGSKTKSRPDFGDEMIAPSKTGTVSFAKSRMTASLIPVKGNPEVSTVHGNLNLGKGVTQISTDALFEGLFFHKYGHLSAVVGASGEELKVVWNPTVATTTAAAPATTGNAPHTPAIDNSAGGDRLASEGGDSRNSTAATAAAAAAGTPPDGGENSTAIVGNSTEGRDAAGAPGKGGAGTTDDADGEDAEASGDLGKVGKGGGNGGTRGRALQDLTVEVEGVGEVGGGVIGRRPSSLERLESGQESTEQVAAAAAAAAAAAGSAGGVGRWFWSEEEEDSEGTDVNVGGSRRWGGDYSGQRTGDSRRHEADPQRDGNEVAATPRHVGSIPGFGLSPLASFPRKDNTAAAAATPGEVNGKENEEEARGGAGTGGATALTREFPAMVLPKEAVVLAGQKSGSLPSQWYNIREEYGQGCLFLLTLQTVEEQDADADGVDALTTEGGEAANARKPLADLMRGEMVGVNCNFSAVVELKLSAGTLRPSSSISYSVLFTMVCLLQMCLLLCRVGLMLAQRRYGRNFMVPRRFQPPKFDYHRPIPPELSAQAEAETSGAQPSEETRDVEAGNCLECAICYAAVDSSVEDYMLTPCDHVFHQGCLTRWMGIKMECPTCRRELPPQLER
ncbi:unnamed protein product [Pylaiella littoralis]